MSSAKQGTNEFSSCPHVRKFVCTLFYRANAREPGNPQDSLACTADLTKQPHALKNTGRKEEAPLGYTIIPKNRQKRGSALRPYHYAQKAWAEKRKSYESY